MCLSVGVPNITHANSEDCLFLDVYAPTQAKTSQLPVFVFIQGGGFSANQNPNLNGSGLVEASENNVVILNFNYRVGPYGFLASEEIVAGGNTNNGLLDQRKVFEWVQKYISKVTPAPPLDEIATDITVVRRRPRPRHHWRRLCWWNINNNTSDGVRRAQRQFIPCDRF